MKKKNIVVFFTDEQRFDSLGCNGNTYAKTPFIDGLATEGCNFSRHIAANPVCMPSRASFMTGRYVPGHGVSSNGIPLWRRDNGCVDENNKICQTIFKQDVPNKIPTMADLLTEAGYHTALLGKLHAQSTLADASYGFRESYSMWEKEETETIDAPFYGFQYVRQVLGHGESPARYDHGHYGRWLHREHPEIIEAITTAPKERLEGVTNGGIYPSKIPSKYHNTMWLADEACTYIEQQKEEETPFFMFIGFPDPHNDFAPPYDLANQFINDPLPDFARLEAVTGGKPQGAQELISKNHATQKNIAVAYQYTQAMVHLIDRGVGHVVEKLKEENMYDDTIIVFTSDHGDLLGDFEALLKGDQPFYSLVHIPFIIKPAKGQELPKTYAQPMSNADVLPTLFNMLEIDVPEDVQGVDIFNTEKENLPMTTCYNMTGKNRNLSLFDATYRYTYVVDTGEEELYNHKLDPQEHHNLAGVADYRKLCEEKQLQVLKKHLMCETQTAGHYGVW